MRCVRLSLVFFLYLASTLAVRAEGAIPPCRLDNSYNTVVEETLARAISAYGRLSKPLGIASIRINPAMPTASNDLDVYVVLNGSQSNVDNQGCVIAAPAKGEPLDTTSVRGGCVIVAIDRMELRCSSSAVRIFGNAGQRTATANPALLYVLAHELGHLYQRRIGEYSGQTEQIDLSWDKPKKIQALQEACDPTLVSREAEADELSLGVLARLLAAPPYREPVFTERGSLYWNIDRLALASEAWQQEVAAHGLATTQTLHESFTPIEFPTPRKIVEKKARRFVCDVLQKRRGVMVYPGKSISHPPAEQRLRRIAEALKPVADALPATGEGKDFIPVAKLQGDVSEILTKIYLGTGVYHEALQGRICSIVNAPAADSGCR